MIADGAVHQTHGVAAADLPTQPGTPVRGSGSQRAPSNGRAGLPGRRRLSVAPRGGIERGKTAWVAIVVASGNYPDDAAMKLGLQIRGLAEIPRGALIFHAGTRFEPGTGLVTDGGRVVTSAALGDTVAEAREKALAGARQVRFPGAFFRSDIAAEAVI